MNKKWSSWRRFASASISTTLSLATVAGCALLITVAWGCSSESEEPSETQLTERPNLKHYVFDQAEEPDWHMDWTGNDVEPVWKEPESSKHECSMNLLQTLEPELIPWSTDEDRMAIFINGECRSVSERNVQPDGNVLFLNHIKGTSEEAGAPTETRYYSGGAHLLFITEASPMFTPNNFVDDTYTIIFSPIGCSTKFPVFTELNVLLPDELPFHATEQDRMSIFVGDECRGICFLGGDIFPGWKCVVNQRRKMENASLRYYSAEKNGIYAFTDSFQLNDRLQAIDILF